jgi:methyl-accepting chemotaxis protein
MDMMENAMSRTDGIIQEIKEASEQQTTMSQEMQEVTGRAEDAAIQVNGFMKKIAGNIVDTAELSESVAAEAQNLVTV